MKKVKNLEKLYEKVAEEYPHDALLDSYHHTRRLEIVDKFLNKLGKNLKVLDAGCGDGIQAEIFAKNHNVTGVDISSIRIKRAKERVKKAKFYVGNLYDLDFPDNTFDVAIASEIIEHLTDPVKALKEIKRVLKPNGYVIIDLPSRSNFCDAFFRLFKIDKNLDWGLYTDKTHIAFYTMGEIKDILEKAGFKPKCIRGGPTFRYNLKFFRKHFLRRKNRWWFLRLIDYILGSTPYIRQFGSVQIFLAQSKKESSG